MLELEQKLLSIASLRRQERLHKEKRRDQVIADAAEKEARDQEAKSAHAQAEAKQRLRLQKEAKDLQVIEHERLRASRLHELASQDAMKGLDLAAEGLDNVSSALSALRGECTRLIEAHDFGSASQASGSYDARSQATAQLKELEESIQEKVVIWLCTNSAASYVASAKLVGEKHQDILHCVAAVAKEVEVVVETLEDSAPDQVSSTNMQDNEVVSCMREEVVQALVQVFNTVIGI